MGAGPAKMLQPSRLLRQRQQVAAVCYRIRKSKIEFLLVQTRGGRWIFPKGGVEAGLTQAQSAALEAFEEAGVHGRMEEIPFTRYFRQAPDTVTAGRDAELDPGVAAYLCEVSRLEKPQESNRKPTWFFVEKAKQRLREKRRDDFGGELVRVVDRAAARIRRLRAASFEGMAIHNTFAREMPPRATRDSLQESYLETSNPGHISGFIGTAAYARYIRQERSEFPAQPRLRLTNGTGSPSTKPQNLRFIDEARGLDGTHGSADLQPKRRK